MVQVKIVRADPSSMEDRINDALRQLGSQPGIKIPSIDVKYTPSPISNGMDVAMIIYNAVRVQTQNTKT